MTNDMIALASIWEDRLRPPKCDKKEDPQVWATSLPHLLTLTQKEKKLNPKAMITYKRPTTIGQRKRKILLQVVEVYAFFIPFVNLVSFHCKHHNQS